MSTPYQIRSVISPPALRRRYTAAFTLVELLVAMTVLLVLALMMVTLANQTNNIWRSSRTRSKLSRARTAFERLTTNLSQATLNTYLDYYNSTAVSAMSRSDLIRAAEANNPSGGTGFENVVQNFNPAAYDRASELQFVCGPSQDTAQDGQGITPLLPNGSITRPTHAIFFTCPLGHVSDPITTGTTVTNDFKTLDRVLSAVGYYVEFNNATGTKLNMVPAFITPAPASWRYRLMEMNQPSQNLAVYSSSTFQNPGDSFSMSNAWFSLAVDSTNTPPVIVLADNIVALIVHPKSANPTPLTINTLTDVAPYYYYDSKGYYNTEYANKNPTGANPPVPEAQKNQLPPLVQVTLVAIDSDSATRLAARYGTTAPPLVKSGLFTAVDSSTGSNDGATYTADLATLTGNLQALHLNYRVFVTDVSVPGAKWSQGQTTAN